jgi:hypothetical protein
MNRARTVKAAPRPTAQDFERAVEAVFAEYPSALFIMPAYLELETHKKIKANFPKTRLSDVKSAILQMVEGEQIWPFVVTGATLEDGSAAIVYKLNSQHRKNIIQFPG